MHFTLDFFSFFRVVYSHDELVTRDKSQIAWSEIVGNNRLQACTPTAARHAGPSRLSKGVSIPRCNYSLHPICGRLRFLSVCPPPPLLLIFVKAVVVRVQRARRQRREERTRNPLDRGVVLPARGELVDAVGFERAAARPSPFRSESAAAREERGAQSRSSRGTLVAHTTTTTTKRLRRDRGREHDHRASSRHPAPSSVAKLRARARSHTTPGRRREQARAGQDDDATGGPQRR